MSKTPDIVFLFDVDNTLIDNDRVQAHLKEHLAQTYGTVARDRYWEILEGLRNELGYVDYLGALERFRIEAMHRPEVLRMSNWLVDYPFADRLYPDALSAVKHVRQWGTPVIPLNLRIDNSDDIELQIGIVESRNDIELHPGLQRPAVEREAENNYQPINRCPNWAGHVYLPRALRSRSTSLGPPENNRDRGYTPDTSDARGLGPGPRLLRREIDVPSKAPFSRLK
jgi:hypothetical protein